MAAFKIPKQTDSEKSLRSESIQSAFKNATQTSLTVSKGCLDVLELALLIAGKANKNTASDLGVAGQMAYAGVEGAVMNVKINLPSIKDTKWAEEKKVDALGFVKRAQTIQTQVLQATNKLND